MSNELKWSLLLLGCALASASGCNRGESTSHEPPVELVFVGDIMLDDGPGKAVAAGVDPFAEFAQVFDRADLCIGNLECVVSTSGERVEKPYNFRAHPRCVPLLKRYFDGVSAANNHSGDFGPGALCEQLDRLHEAGLPCFGAGRNLREAHTPWIVERGGVRFAILGYNEFQPSAFEAGATTPGLAWSDDDQVVADIREARERHRADLVIPFMHWGWEYEQENDRQRELSKKMIDAGADLVIGNHPHVTQGVESYRGKLIVYSLGNFVFDGFDERPNAQVGWVLRLSMNKQGLVSWQTLVARMDKQGIPHLDKNVASPSGELDRRLAQQP
jgi:poly-gamma-glutamate synthesis protein (capsule biosynthesis protein)